MGGGGGRTEAPRLSTGASLVREHRLGSAHTPTYMRPAEEESNIQGLDDRTSKGNRVYHTADIAPRGARPLQVVYVQEQWSENAEG